MLLLTFLNMEKNGFDGEIPACIGSLTLLTFLNLSDNEDIAGELTTGICDLVNLEFLEIEETSMEGKHPRLN
jgi:hypothetical protein